MLKLTHFGLEFGLGDLTDFLEVFEPFSEHILSTDSVHSLDPQQHLVFGRMRNGITTKRHLENIIFQILIFILINRIVKQCSFNRQNCAKIPNKQLLILKLTKMIFHRRILQDDIFECISQRVRFPFEDKSSAIISVRTGIIGQHHQTIGRGRGHSFLTFNLTQKLQKRNTRVIFLFTNLRVDIYFSLKKYFSS